MGYICGDQTQVSDQIQGAERFNDGILDVFDMTLLAYIMFNIPPYDDIHRKIIDKVPVNGSYMSESIQTEFMSQFFTCSMETASARINWRVSTLRATKMTGRTVHFTNLNIWDRRVRATALGGLDGEPRQQRSAPA